MCIVAVCVQALAQAKTAPSVLGVCSSKKLLEMFVESNKLLDSVQKGLADVIMEMLSFEGAELKIMVRFDQLLITPTPS